MRRVVKEESGEGNVTVTGADPEVFHFFHFVTLKQGSPAARGRVRVTAGLPFKAKEGDDLCMPVRLEVLTGRPKHRCGAVGQCFPD